MAIFRQMNREPSLDEIVPALGDVDLVLTEGFKQAHTPKIEVSRRERGTRLVCRIDEIIAIVSDHNTDLGVPHFDLDDAAGVATLIQEHYLR
jgi:molybdopterin-guanine dinucleotide biosynthesis protein B